MNTMPQKPLAKSLGLGLLTFALLAGGFLLPACSAQEGSAAGADDFMDKPFDTLRVRVKETPKSWRS